MDLLGKVILELTPLTQIGSTIGAMNWRVLFRMFRDIHLDRSAGLAIELVVQLFSGHREHHALFSRECESLPIRHFAAYEQRRRLPRERFRAILAAALLGAASSTKGSTDLAHHIDDFT